MAIGLRTAASGAVAGMRKAQSAPWPSWSVLPSRLRRRIGNTARCCATTIAAACRDHERLRFGYHAHDGAITVPATQPHRLVSSARRWYLLAWDVGLQDWRTFRVDQMDLRLPAGPRFTPKQMSDEEVADRIGHRDRWPSLPGAGDRCSRPPDPTRRGALGGAGRARDYAVTLVRDGGVGDHAAAHRVDRGAGGRGHGARC